MKTLYDMMQAWAEAGMTGPVTLTVSRPDFLALSADLQTRFDCVPLRAGPDGMVRASIHGFGVLWTVQAQMDPVEETKAVIAWSADLEAATKRMEALLPKCECPHARERHWPDGCDVAGCDCKWSGPARVAPSYADSFGGPKSGPAE